MEGRHKHRPDPTQKTSRAQNQGCVHHSIRRTTAAATPTALTTGEWWHMTVTKPPQLQQPANSNTKGRHTHTTPTCISSSSNSDSSTHEVALHCSSTLASMRTKHHDSLGMHAVLAQCAALLCFLTAPLMASFVPTQTDTNTPHTQVTLPPSQQPTQTPWGQGREVSSAAAHYTHRRCCSKCCCCSAIRTTLHCIAEQLHKMITGSKWPQVC